MTVPGEALEPPVLLSSDSEVGEGAMAEGAAVDDMMSCNFSLVNHLMFCLQ